MKRTPLFRTVAVLALAILLIASLAACGGPSEPKQPTGPTGGEPANDSFAFLWKGTPIRPGDVGTDMKALAGEWKSCFESPSCAFAGIDKTYTFAGFVIDTTPSEDGKDDIIKSIRLTDDSVTTGEGAGSVYVGCSLDKVKEVYGESIGLSDACLRYVSGDVELQFITQDGKVISIEYIPAE